MVLTRAQAAAQANAQAAAQAAYAAAQAAASPEAQAAVTHASEIVSQAGHGFNHHADTAIVPYMATAQTSAFELTPSAAQHVMNLAQQFISLTQALAHDQAVFQQLQRGETDAQNTALLAVQASTESSMQQLTEQQRTIAHQLGEALAATHNKLESQFQRMQVLEGDRVKQIEMFVNQRQGEALQEVNQSREVITSQTNSARKLLAEIEETVAKSQAAIATHIRQIVEDRLAGLQHDALSAARVQGVVEETVAAAVAESKKTIDAELQRARNEIQRETAARIEEPVRHLVLELTTQAARQLESRVQSVVTNTQSEMNLQLQRQADATSVLRDKLRKQQMRSKLQFNRDEALLKTTIQEVLRDNPDLVNPEREEQQSTVPQGDTQQPSTVLGGDTQKSRTVLRDDEGHVEFAEPLNVALERSIGAAATTIGNAINGGVCSLTQASYRRSHTLDDSDSEDDTWVSTRDRQMENRMKDAWRKAYLCSQSGQPSPDAVLPNESESSQDDQVDDKPEGSARHGVTSEGVVSSFQTQLPFASGVGFNSGVVVVVPPTQTQIFLQKKTRYERHLPAPSPRHVQFQEIEEYQQPAPRQIQSRGRHHQIHPPVPPRLQSGEHRHQVQRHPKQARTNEMQRLVDGLQRDVVARADRAARRYSTKK